MTKDAEIRLTQKQIDNMQRLAYKAKSYWPKFAEEAIGIIQILEIAKSGEVRITHWPEETKQ